MSEKVFTRSLENGLWQWRLTTANGQWDGVNYSVGDSEALAGSLPNGSLPACLILAGQQVVTCNLEMDVKEKRHIAKLLPFEMEDRLVDSIEDLHFTHCDAEGNKITALYLKSEVLGSTLEKFEPLNCDVQTCLPDYLLLKRDDDGATIVFDEDVVLGNFANGTGFSIEVNTAPIVLGALSSELKPAGTLNLVAHSEEDISKLREWLPQDWFDSTSAIQVDRSGSDAKPEEKQAGLQDFVDEQESLEDSAGLDITQRNEVLAAKHADSLEAAPLDNHAGDEELETESDQAPNIEEGLESIDQSLSDSLSDTEEQDAVAQQTDDASDSSVENIDSDNSEEEDATDNSVGGHGELVVSGHIGGFWDWVDTSIPSSQLNLRSGAYARQLPFARWWNTWKIPAYFFAAAFVFALAVSFAQYLSAKSEFKNIVARTNAIYQDAVPNGKKGDPEGRLKSLVRTIGGSGSAQPSNFLSLLNGVAQSMRTIDGITMTSIRYNNEQRELRLNLTAKSFADLEKLRSAVGQRGLSAELLNVNAQGEIQQARMKVVEAK